jgi:hypothetical protein
MSHIVTINTQIRDPAALASACRRLGLQEPVHGTVRMYSAVATGLIIRLPDWRYPVVIDTTKAEVQFDNYGGAWGEQGHLDRLMQAYAVEKARLEARKAGHTVTEQALPDGSIKLIVQAGGAA